MDQELVQKTIVVVDDNMAICCLIVELLTPFGYIVLAAQMAQTALDIIKKQ